MALLRVMGRWEELMGVVLTQVSGRGRCKQRGQGDKGHWDSCRPRGALCTFPWVAARC